MTNKNIKTKTAPAVAIPAGDDKPKQTATESALVRSVIIEQTRKMYKHVGLHGCHLHHQGHQDSGGGDVLEDGDKIRQKS